jgi:hypothetical protein
MESFNIRHSPFVIKYNLQSALLGICVIDTPVYSVAKCVFLMEELGILKLNAIQMIYDYKEENKSFDDAIFCFDMFLKQEQ